MLAMLLPDVAERNVNWAVVQAALPVFKQNWSLPFLPETLPLA